MSDDRRPPGSEAPGPLGVRTLAGGVLSLRLAAAPGVRALLVSGVLDGRCAAELPGELLAAAGACPEGLVLDLQGVGECDVAGVVALAGACEHARQAGHSIGLAASTAELDRLTELQDLTDLAADAWQRGDLQTAYEAATAAMPAAAGASAALNVLLELERARAESDQERRGGPAGQWLG
nr:STAS domain-containing protein [Streptomyces sp. TLI_235]